MTYETTAKGANTLAQYETIAKGEHTLVPYETLAKGANTLVQYEKTAYEIIAGDWSSDVCSSDLTGVELVINELL